MSATDPGEEFWHDLAAAQNNLDPDASDAWSHADSELCDESDDFTPSDDENQQIVDAVYSRQLLAIGVAMKTRMMRAKGVLLSTFRKHLPTKICSHLTPPPNQWILKNRIGELPIPQSPKAKI